MHTIETATDVGGLLREWREHRRYSQLALSSETGISTRHLSFVETGKSNPGRDLLLRLAEHLDLPLRERNRLLLAGGFAPAFPADDLDGDRSQGVRAQLRRLLDVHAPYPALVVDAAWNVVDANAHVGILLQGVDRALLAPPMNALRVTLDPRGMAPHIENLEQWREHLLGRARRQASLTRDGRLLEVLHEYDVHEHDEPGGHEPGTAPHDGEIALPLRLRVGGETLSFLSTISTFGTPLDVTLSELAVEAFLPADDATRRALERFEPVLQPDDVLGG
ncbi:helix-turn-helix domain-containing protein [Agromyces sp. LHK192]|uniref:helix-turn-helix domain-containing protein n=1 Tax=Agromyces sp. LHK192 TaxID=2498704 RepID=UPI000FDB40D2|nr:helix-turn-helix transcriptional regulator [Agromyces sp. LHK192]